MIGGENMIKSILISTVLFLIIAVTSNSNAQVEDRQFTDTYSTKNSELNEQIEFTSWINLEGLPPVGD